MKIQTVDNFNSQYSNFNDDVKKGFSFGQGSYHFISLAEVKNNIFLTLKEYVNNKNNTFFSFFLDEDKINVKNGDDLIITCKKNSDNYYAETGNYVGNFLLDDGSKNGLKIDIKSRFNNKFLERMLNFANDIFLDDVSVTGKETTNSIDISKFIIYYMFIQKLEKAFLLGLPKSYRSINHHEMKLKGKIDINRFIKHDIPFKGKVSSTSREQKEIQEIVDVLYKAVKIIESNKFPTKNISHIKTHLKQHRSNKYVSNETITKAINSKALQNPIFAPYKKVLEYARFIINGSNLEEKKDGKEKTYGFLVNVAELFEIYITKLLQKEFPEWAVESPSIKLNSKDEFSDSSYLYARRIIPDITMIHKDTKTVMVFDTKYKRMKFNKDMYGSGSDIDRGDFFQINTYMNYYNNQEQYTLKAGGLLYPIEENMFNERFDKNGKEYSHNREHQAHSSSWFGNESVKFIVDGIDLSNLEKGADQFSEEEIEAKNKLIRKNIQESEEKFIRRVKSLTE